jgi:hypothetical protein
MRKSRSLLIRYQSLRDSQAFDVALFPSHCGGSANLSQGQISCYRVSFIQRSVREQLNERPCIILCLVLTILIDVIREEGCVMHVLILIEPIEGDRFRAKAGEPFGLSAEGKTAEEAAIQLETILRGRLHGGSRLALLDLGNGSSPAPALLHLEPLPDDDWFFQTMRDAIVENRQREDEADG